MLNDKSVYETIIPAIEDLVKENLPAVSVLSNTAALLFNSFEKISWAGFYLLKGKSLYLGPFQGRPACTVINIKNGVCGKSVREKTTVIVEDVDQFPGHIACDSDSKSEIVVPLVSGGNLYGVIDIDSHSYSSFGETDRKYLKKISDLISENYTETLFLN